MPSASAWPGGRASSGAAGAPGSRGAFDLIVGNPPYVAAGDLAGLEPEVRAFEPEIALSAGPDGLAAYRALIPDCARLLAPGGHVVLEIGQGQGAAVAAILVDPRPRGRSGGVPIWPGSSAAWWRKAPRRATNSSAAGTIALCLPHRRSAQVGRSRGSVDPVPRQKRWSVMLGTPNPRVQPSCVPDQDGACARRGEPARGLRAAGRDHGAGGGRGAADGHRDHACSRPRSPRAFSSTVGSWRSTRSTCARG